MPMPSQPKPSYFPQPKAFTDDTKHPRIYLMARRPILANAKTRQEAIDLAIRHSHFSVFPDTTVISHQRMHDFLTRIRYQEADKKQSTPSPCGAWRVDVVRYSEELVGKDSDAPTFSLGQIYDIEMTTFLGPRPLDQPDVCIDIEHWNALRLAFDERESLSETTLPGSQLTEAFPRSL